jgi:protein SCO1/2
MRFTKAHKITIATALILSLGAAGSSYWYWFGKPKTTYPKAPDFTLQSIDGRNVSFGTHSDKIRFVEFFYAECPDVCPTTTANMVRIQNELKKQNLFGNQVQFISITLDPTRDTPAVLKQYAKNLGVDLTGWTFLRGSESDTEQVTKAFGVYTKKEADGFITHSTHALFLIDKQNNIRNIYQEGDKMPTTQIVKDIENVAKEND